MVEERIWESRIATFSGISTKLWFQTTYASCGMKRRTAWYNNSWDWLSLKVILRLNNNVLCHRRGVVDSVTVQIFKRDVNKVGG